MATSKPLSTINYCSEEFTHYILQKWVDSHLIQFALYIMHKGEDGDKDHMHLLVFPNKKLDPMDLRAELQELDPLNPKPLGTLEWRISSEEDWLLYSYHNKEYLRRHEELKEANSKIEYSIEDIKSVGLIDIDSLHLRALAKMNKGSQGVYASLKQGELPENLIMKGASPTLVGQIMKTCHIANVDRERFILNQFKNLIIKLNDVGYDVDSLGIDEKIFSLFDSFDINF